jgi:GT2 family glycosyltransferase
VENPPLVSAIVVCWNAAAVIGRCLEHLLAQDHPHFEIVVVDDGSDDDTLAIAEEARRGAQVHVEIVRSPRNRGCAHARNLGLRAAQGEILAFIDADGFAAPDWLRALAAAFAREASLGAVASTVLLDSNPLVLNGAGGTVNRQGWAADLGMGESYEHAELASEALYAMGCGMAFRRSVIERVGGYDEAMLNYYDDVDYGIRVWRAGSRVGVASGALVDHDFTAADASPRKALLCERHRIRVMLKHRRGRGLAEWVGQELRTLRAAAPARRRLKLRAMIWNVRHGPSLLVARRRLSKALPLPERLLDGSWGDGFPVGLALLSQPNVESAAPVLAMASGGEEQLVYGWFPREEVQGRSYRWAAAWARSLLSVDHRVRRLHLDFAHVPVDTGGVDVSLRRPGAVEPAWTSHLDWQFLARTVENHVVSLEPGVYEVSFAARAPWSSPPQETRALGLALSEVSLHESFEIPDGRIEMGSPAAPDQLVSGWYDAESGPEGAFRWGGSRAEAVVRLVGAVEAVRIRYRLPPAPTDGMRLELLALEGGEPHWSASVPWEDGEWHERRLTVGVAPGEYRLRLAARDAWSNPARRDPALWAENRTLGFAIARVAFEPST